MKQSKKSESQSVEDFILKLEYSAKKILKDATKRQRESDKIERAQALYGKPKPKPDQKSFEQTGTVLFSSNSYNNDTIKLPGKSISDVNPANIASATQIMAYSVPKMSIEINPTISALSNQTLKLKSKKLMSSSLPLPIKPSQLETLNNDLTLQKLTNDPNKKLEPIVKRSVVLEKLASSPYVSATQSSPRLGTPNGKRRSKEDSPPTEDSNWNLRIKAAEILSGRPRSSVNKVYNRLMKGREEKGDLSTELQGPLDWSHHGLRSKYRGEKEREDAWVSWKYAHSYSEQALKEDQLVLPVAKVQRHPLYLLFHRLTEHENQESCKKTRERLKMKKFVLDVMEVWLTNLQHLREHQPARLLRTEGMLLTNSLPAPPLTASTKLRSSSNISVSLPEGFDLYSEENEEMQSGKLPLFSPSLKAPQSVSRKPGKSPKSSSSLSPSKPLNSSSSRLLPASQSDELRDLCRGNGLEARRDTDTISSLDSQIQSVSLERATAKAFRPPSQPLPAPSVDVDQRFLLNRHLVPKLLPPPPQPPSIESLIGGSPPYLLSLSPQSPSVRGPLSPSLRPHRVYFKKGPGAILRAGPSGSSSPFTEGQSEGRPICSQEREWTIHEDGFYPLPASSHALLRIDRLVPSVDSFRFDLNEVLWRFSIMRRNKGWDWVEGEKDRDEHQWPEERKQVSRRGVGLGAAEGMATSRFVVTEQSLGPLLSRLKDECDSSEQTAMEELNKRLGEGSLGSEFEFLGERDCTVRYRALQPGQREEEDVGFEEIPAKAQIYLSVFPLSLPTAPTINSTFPSLPPPRTEELVYCTFVVTPLPPQLPPQPPPPSTSPPSSSSPTPVTPLVTSSKKPSSNQPSSPSSPSLTSTPSTFIPPSYPLLPCTACFSSLQLRAGLGMEPGIPTGEEKEGGLEGEEVVGEGGNNGATAVWSGWGGQWWRQRERWEDFWPRVVERLQVSGVGCDGEGRALSLGLRYQPTPASRLSSHSPSSLPPSTIKVISTSEKRPVTAPLRSPSPSPSPRNLSLDPLDNSEPFCDYPFPSDPPPCLSSLDALRVALRLAKYIILPAPIDSPSRRSLNSFCAASEPSMVDQLVIKMGGMQLKIRALPETDPSANLPSDLDFESDDQGDLIESKAADSQNLVPVLSLASQGCFSLLTSKKHRTRPPFHRSLSYLHSLTISGLWESLRAESAASSLEASGNLHRCFQVPGACEIGRMGLWSPHRMGREFTQAAANFFRDPLLSTTNTVFATLTLALDDSVLFEMRTAWEPDPVLPPRSPPEPVPPVVSLTSHLPTSLLSSPLHSPLSDRISPLVPIFSTVPVVGLDYLSLEKLQAMQKRHPPPRPKSPLKSSHSNSPSRPSTAQTPHDSKSVSNSLNYQYLHIYPTRHHSEFSANGFRQLLTFPLLDSDPNLPTQIYGVSNFNARPNALGVNPRNVWHNVCPVTEHINKPRFSKDVHYMAQNSETRGANDPNSFTICMRGGECSSLRLTALHLYEKEYLNIKDERAEQKRQLALMTKIENSQVMLRVKEKETKSRIQLQVQLEVEKKMRKATKSELGWRRRYFSSLLLDRQGKWERRRDARTGAIFFYKMPNKSSAVDESNYMENCQWEVPAAWVGDPLADPEDPSLDPEVVKFEKSFGFSKLQQSYGTVDNKAAFEQPGDSWLPEVTSSSGLVSSVNLNDMKTPGARPTTTQEKHMKFSRPKSVRIADQSGSESSSLGLGLNGGGEVDDLVEKLSQNQELIRALAAKLGLTLPSPAQNNTAPSVRGDEELKFDKDGQLIPVLAKREDNEEVFEPEFDSDDDVWSDEENEAGDRGEEALGPMQTSLKDNAQIRREKWRNTHSSSLTDEKVPFLHLAEKGLGQGESNKARDPSADWRKLPRPEIRANFLSQCTKTRVISADMQSRFINDERSKNLAIEDVFSPRRDETLNLNRPMFLMPISPTDACQYVPESFSMPIEAIFVPDIKVEMERALATVQRNIRREEELARALPTDDLLLFGSAQAMTTVDQYVVNQYKDDQNIFADPKDAALERAIVAAKANNIGQLEDALDEDINVNATDEFGNTLLILASQQGSKRVCKFLLRRGCNINAQNTSGNTVLHYCYAYAQIDLAKYLMSKGADDSILNLEGMTCYEGLSKDMMDKKLGGEDEFHL